MRCVKCERTYSTDQFRTEDGRLRKTCKRCRERAKVQYAQDAAIRAGRPCTIPTVTMQDHPRKYFPQGDRASYDALHQECLARGWVLGADPTVNWCLIHQHKARLECDDCLREATAWQGARKHAETLGKLHALTQTEARVREDRIVDPMPPRGFGGKHPNGWKARAFGAVEDSLRIYQT